jgi:class 3 adenylate cyclase
VFLLLLEQSYHDFDQIAKKLGVFKVETIGDCYVATTGLSEPRDDHAELMAVFAKESLSKMNQVVTVLAERLGEETLLLSLRVGIHSGPITAVVQRGEKSCFQLFR